MIPKLLISRDVNALQLPINKLIANFAVFKFDTYILGLDGSVIKIEEIRDLRKKLNLAPVQGKFKMLLIYSAQNLTVEAQNALLKTLEEPPEDTIIILTTSNEHLLLPTITSRCEVIRIKNLELRIKNTKKQFNNPPRTEWYRGLTIEQLLKMDTGEKFALAEKLSAKENKDEALDTIRKRADLWLQTVINTILRSIVVNNTEYQSTGKNLKIVKIFINAQKRIRQNLNIRLSLENCFLELKNNA